MYVVVVVLSAGGVGLRWENWVDVEADEKAPTSSRFGLALWDTSSLRGGVQQPRGLSSIVHYAVLGMLLYKHS